MDERALLLERTYYILFMDAGDADGRKLTYRKYTGRDPDVMHTPEETRTPWFWYGFASSKERDACDKDRQFGF